MKLASFLFLGLIFAAGSVLAVPSFSYAQDESQINVFAVVLEQITVYQKGKNISASTNSRNGYWIINNHIVVSKF